MLFCMASSFLYVFELRIFCIFYKYVSLKSNALEYITLNLSIIFKN